jgi:hypothetical protein
LDGFFKEITDDEFVSFLLLITERKPCCGGECLVIGDVLSINISVTEKPDLGFLFSFDRGVLDRGDACRSSFVVIFNLCS